MFILFLYFPSLPLIERDLGSDDDRLGPRSETDGFRSHCSKSGVSVLESEMLLNTFYSEVGRQNSVDASCPTP